MTRKTLRLFQLALAVLRLATLAACGGGNSVQAPPAEPSSSQDAWVFSPVVEAIFAALSSSTVDTDRWTGVLNNVVYRIEVHKTG